MQISIGCVTGSAVVSDQIKRGKQRAQPSQEVAQRVKRIKQRLRTAREIKVVDRSAILRINRGGTTIGHLFRERP